MSQLISRGITWGARSAYKAYTGSKGLRKRPRRTRRRVRASLTGNKKGIYYFTRRQFSNFTFTTNAQGNSAQQTLRFAFSGVPNNSEFNELFDNYKMVGVSTQFIYSGGNVSSTSTAISQMPCLWWYHDKYENNDATTFTAMIERSKSKRFLFGNNNKQDKTLSTPMYVKYELQSIDGTGTGQTSKKSPWLDVQNDKDLSHGVTRVALKGEPSTTYNFDVIYTFRFMMKSVI